MLLDTSGLFVYFNPSDLRHADAVAFVTAGQPLLTHNYVLAEFVALAEVRRLNRPNFLAFVADLQDNPLVQVVYVTEDRHRAALDLLQRRLDKAWSLCDAVSFLLMGEYGVTDALTTDHHFEQASFVRLLKR